MDADKPGVVERAPPVGAVVNKPLRVLSLGAGVQSSTLALMAAQGEIDRPDCAIFADTQSEPASVYRWLEWLEKKLPYPVHRVSKGNLSEIALIIRKSKNGIFYQQSAPPAWVLENGRINMMMRQCTKDFKIDPIRKKLREIGGKDSKVEQYIGISLDEAHRMKPARDSWIKNRWPLIELRMSRNDCMVWMKKNGYPEPPRSSCWMCPYHSNAEWRRLKNEEPDYFEMAKKWEADFQSTMNLVSGFRGRPYLHRTCVALAEIDFDAKSPQIDMFGDECEGLCGV